MIQVQYKTQPDWLAEAARDLLPSTVAVSTANPRRGWSGLHPDEMPATANMAELRRLEYTAGRQAQGNRMSFIPELSGTENPRPKPPNVVLA